MFVCFSRHIGYAKYVGNYVPERFGGRHSSTISKGKRVAHYERHKMSVNEANKAHRAKVEGTTEFLADLNAALDKMEDFDKMLAWSEAKYDLYQTVANAIGEYWEATR